jgi:hypothetical protein
LEGSRSAVLTRQLLQIGLQLSPLGYHFRAVAAGVHVSADAISEGQHFLHIPGYVARIAVISVMLLQAIGRPFELLHAVVIGIVRAFQTFDRIFEFAAEMIRVLLDALDQVAKVSASRSLRRTSRRLYRLYGDFLDSLYNDRLCTSLRDSLIHSLLYHDRLRDRLYGVAGTRSLPERRQPDTRKGRDHETCNDIPDLSFHNLLHVSSSSQLPRTTARRRVGPRCLRNCASANVIGLFIAD